MFADTHTHLLDERFDDIRQDVISDFSKNGIAFVIENGTDLKDSLAAAKLAQANKQIYAAVGVHPHSADEYNSDAEDALKEYIKKYSKIVAIGEIGLDYHYDFSPRDKQIKAFEAQISLAESLDMPVVIHSREAAQDTFDILKNAKVRGELHCFSGSAEMAEAYLDKGFYIAFGGAITFKNANKLLRAVEAVPLSRMLSETDCPYMTPVPYRGQTNFPAYAKLVIDKIAEIKNESADLVMSATLENAKKLFGIKGE